MSINRQIGKQNVVSVSVASMTYNSILKRKESLKHLQHKL